jgi:hypothetical protein
MDGMNLKSFRFLMSTRRPLTRAVLGGLLLAKASLWAQSTPAAVPDANPARPTVTTPATLTPVGYLQFETGALFAQTSPEFSNLGNINEVTKLAVHPRIQLILELNPVASASGEVNDAGFGGLSLGFQAVLLGTGDANTTVAVGYLHEAVSSPIPDTDIGTPTNSGLLLFSTNASKFHLDINGIFNQQTVTNISRTQYGQTLSISHPLWKLTGQAEVWHFTQPFLHRDAAGLLWAVSYAARRNLVFDAGFEHGLTSSSTQWEEFFGFTYLLPHRLWKR